MVPSVDVIQNMSQRKNISAKNFMKKGFANSVYTLLTEICTMLFLRAVCRYESTIVSQFFGHTHYDEFELFYDTENLGRAVSIAYIGPSVTPYADLNPGYRIYYVDGDHEDTTRVSNSLPEKLC